MRAYNISMLLIMINAAGILIISTGAFPGLIGPGGNAESLLLTLGREGFGIGDVTVSVVAIAAILMTATAVLLGSRGPSASGIAIFTFAVIFWGSLLMMLDLLATIPLPGINTFLAIFATIAVLIFIATIVQMPTGGMKSFD